MAVRRISLALMIFSWAIGLYFIEYYFKRVSLVVQLDQFYWVSPFKGLLGLTLIVSFLTIGLYGMHQRKFIRWGIVFTWIAVLLIQTKMIAYNLALCH
ncbi:hypothetical protein [Ammoniphilus sp. YIM 78166]|uniref:hypothetical protein n=1 Tax=Ammoniphilus sp. YIM 78166 TaxID=1644106 RepID=UPI00106F2CA4|nr:hypothetical protein [Ammoniphilus sp. YIM 78166]